MKLLKPLMILIMGFKSIYIKIVRFFDTNILSIFIGVTSGIAVNLATGQEATGYFLCAIVANIFAVIFLAILVTFRNNIDKTIEEREDIPGSIDEKWIGYTNYEKKWVALKYMSSLIFAVFFFALGVWFNIKANNNNIDDANKQKNEITTLMNRILTETNNEKDLIKHYLDSLNSSSKTNHTLKP